MSAPPPPTNPKARGRASAPPPAAPGSRPGPPPSGGSRPAPPPGGLPPPTGGRGASRPGPPPSGFTPAPPAGRSVPSGLNPPPLPPGTQLTSRPGPPPPGASLGRAVYRSKAGETMGPPGGKSTESSSSKSVKSSTGGSGDVATVTSKMASSAISGTAGASGTAGTDLSGSLGRGVVRGGKRDRGGEILKTRPESVMENKKGTSGDLCKIASNYFRLHRKTDWVLLQYRVDFNVEEDRTFEKKRMVRDHKETLGDYIFDGSMLFSINNYCPNGNPLMLTSAGSDSKPVNITIKVVGEVYPTSFHYIQFFNIILRKCMENLNLQQLGRNYYDPKGAVHLKEWKLELWPGYVTSIRQHENDVLLCAEVSTKILRTDTVYDQLRASQKMSSGDYQTNAAKLLLGTIVITRYNNKTYKVDDIMWNDSPMKTFPKRDGTEMTLVEYYKSRYNLVIKDTKQPLILSMPKAADRRAGQDGPILLVPELCNMTGLSDDQRANFKLMKSVADYTRTGPDQRIETLLRFAQRLQGSAEITKELNAWNMKISNELELLSGRTAKPEEILQGQNRKCSYGVENADWGNAFRDFKLFNPTACAKWAVVFPPMFADETKQFVQSLQKVAGPMGFQMGSPLVVNVPKTTTAAYIAEIYKIVDKSPQMIMVVIPNNKGDQYHAIKKVCCIEKPVPTQCITGTILKKPKGMMSVATKVAIQMATKLGAEPWAVAMPIKDTMVIGYDSYHDSAQKGMSVGAVVASINNPMTRYFSQCTFHRNNEELISQMKVCVNNALRRYQDDNKKFPGRVIVYRDGVGDGQIEFVKEHEIMAIKECFQANHFEPRFTYVIVSKRINTRFFRVKSGGATVGKGATNPPSGTVVDDVVTLPERYDFFLVSQSVRQGTVNPTSYNVIEDSSGLRPDHIQKLTYKLTHLYYNWPGTVRVPAPCQYAHKMAFLVGQSLHRAPNTKLDTLLYYL